MSNEFEKKKFQDQIGQKATVQRTQEQSDAIGRGYEKLREIGRDLHPLPDTETEYLGSCALHIYAHEGLGQLFFISQTQTMQDVPEILAVKALTDLNGSVQEFYGHRRPKLRSGF